MEWIIKKTNRSRIVISRTINVLMDNGFFDKQLNPSIKSIGKVG